MTSMYEVNFFLEFGGGVYLWSYDQRTAEAWDGKLDIYGLPISEDLREELARIGSWWENSMSQDPLVPDSWRQNECDRFNEAADAAFDRLCAELGPTWDVIRSFGVMREDPDLDRFIRESRASGSNARGAGRRRRFRQRRRSGNAGQSVHGRGTGSSGSTTTPRVHRVVGSSTD